LAIVPLLKIKPKPKISEKTCLPSLREALYHIFSSCKKDLWLVGGTALAGYYAEHRRSDDLDLFALDAFVHRSATLAVKGLQSRGAVLLNERSSPYYYHTDIQFHGHSFTTDVVLDERLHQIGKAIQTEDGAWVADLPTLFATKAACLVSRCSEKDLFDLDWILSKIENFDIADIIQYGSQIDGGLNVETLLLSLQGAILHKERCHFLLAGSSITVEKAYKKVLSLRKKLTQLLLDYEKRIPISLDVQALSQSVKDQKKIK